MHLGEWIAECDPCACGSSLDKCVFWSEVLEGSNIRLTNGFDLGGGVIAQMSQFLKCLTGTKMGSKEALIIRNNYDVFSRILEKSGVKYIVDSSKTFGRLFALRRSGLFDIYVIHLYRDGRGVAYSRMKAKEKLTMLRRVDMQMPKKIGYTTRRWIVNNLMVLLYWLLCPGSKVFIIQYEELAANPDTAIGKLQEWLGLDWEDLISARADVIHNIGGNDLRLKPLTEIRLDNEWAKKLKLNDKIVYAANGGNLFGAVLKIFKGINQRIART